MAAHLMPAVAFATLGACCWLLILHHRLGPEPEGLPPLPPDRAADARGAGATTAPTTPPTTKKAKPYIPVSVARRSGHAGAVMDSDSVRWWRRINGDGSWN